MSTYQVRSLEEADQIIKEHERKTKTAYALLRSTKNFGCVDVPACANDENEVRFETVGVPYCGVPFFVAGLKILQCQSFRGRGTRKKKEIKVEAPSSPGSGINFNDIGGMEHEEDEIIQATKPLSKKKKKIGRSHQVGCTATIIMKEVIYYPEFQLYEHSKNNRIAVARQLKEALKAKTQVQKDRIIYVTVPSMSDHYGHTVGMNPSRRLYVKNDFYGSNDPGSSKRVYYPVKQEKGNTLQLTKRFKVDEDDTEAKAKEVREMLQSIMALTYKPGTTVAFQELLKDLMQSKLKYQHTMNELLSGAPSVSTGTPTTVNVIASQGIISPFPSTHQVLTVQPAIAKSPESGTVTVATGWPSGRGNNLASSATVIPGTATVVAVASLPLAVSTTTTSGNGVVTVPNSVTVQQPSSSNNGTDANNQETSIFIEAMEAIFNSQI
ncbi:hypothetical protein Anas_00009 [Armadillidium nasatum]|uniref:Uncharacterized protein n=1 Tax=Armadillidium nasatum TaxID=96803 RepID=A0A5N5TGC0_9CRUS|nr:hypothetical protein Anas_00009 [Armadillidium nasatum]